MRRTIVIRRDYLHYIRKYQRYEKRHSTLSAHCSPCFRISEGDQVTVGQCRPLSKTVKFNVIKVSTSDLQQQRTNSDIEQQQRRTVASAAGAAVTPAGEAARLRNRRNGSAV